MKLLTGLLFVTALSCAPMTITSGAMQCGALTRSANTVQAYCYVGNVVVFNSLVLVSPFGVVVPFQYRSNAVNSNITWKFKLTELGAMTYEVADTNDKLTKGNL